MSEKKGVFPNKPRVNLCEVCQLQVFENFLPSIHIACTSLVRGQPDMSAQAIWCDWTFATFSIRGLTFLGREAVSTSHRAVVRSYLSCLSAQSAFRSPIQCALPTTPTTAVALVQWFKYN